MKRILIAYTTNAGSTEDAARAVAGGIAAPGDVVEVRRLEEVENLDGWDAVIVGAPMILGWSRSAVRFVQRHRKALAQKQVAYFCTAMALTATGEQPRAGEPPVFIDPDLPQPPKNAGRVEHQRALRHPVQLPAPGAQCCPRGQAAQRGHVWRQAGILPPEVVAGLVCDGRDSGQPCGPAQSASDVPMGLSGARDDGLDFKPAGCRRLPLADCCLFIRCPGSGSKSYER